MYVCVYMFIYIYSFLGFDGAKSAAHCISPNAANASSVCFAVCCSVLQCVAVCCSVSRRKVCSPLHLPKRSKCVECLRCVAVCCSVLQYVAVCCSVLQSKCVECLQCAHPSEFLHRAFSSKAASSSCCCIGKLSKITKRLCFCCRVSMLCLFSRACSSFPSSSSSSSSSSVPSTCERIRAQPWTDCEGQRGACVCLWMCEYVCVCVCVCFVCVCV